MRLVPRIHGIIFYRHAGGEEEEEGWEATNWMEASNERNINHNDDICSFFRVFMRCEFDDDTSTWNLLLLGIYGDMVIQRIIGISNQMLTVRLCLCVPCGTAIPSAIRSAVSENWPSKLKSSFAFVSWLKLCSLKAPSVHKAPEQNFQLAHRPAGSSHVEKSF